MFGQYPFESEPTIAPDGTVQKSNPWLDQFIEDMEDLLQLDSAADLLCGFSPNKPLTLFQDFSAAFCQVDSTELRVRVLSVHIPPPRYAPPALPHPPPVLAVADPVLPTFPCECMLPDGTTCNFIEQDATRLATHMQKFHSTLFPQARATVTNVCPWCSRIFQRYQTLDITSKNYTGSWSLWQTSRLIHGRNGQSAIVSGLSDVFYPVPVSVSTS